ncbi:hydroxymethylglutaryl-CoA lyase [Candidatus Odyssella thessalonicensis]|uniref:hydroxymethylglutaryl-CoA lyase n=1 Tax=Candidatus Odyssella thessalonicensis TaxID=84647 RepID=UPI000225B91D|nr:hydroxymethylglutaryl-CoA lyase [Candidatus Odyssella thessalonicensis]
MQNKIKVVEVGPRDGLQNENKIWSIAERIQMIDLLSQCGFGEIEVGSFVSPKWVPQMADTEAVYQKIHKTPDCRYSVLVPNQKGMDTALTYNVRDISIFTAASEAFNQKNINCSIEESFERFTPLLHQAKDHNIRVRGYVSCVIECPFSGKVSPTLVATVAERLWQLGCAEISLGDTIGKGTPESTVAMLQAVQERVPLERLAIHCHDTYGRAVENIEAALAEGVMTIDSAITGLGGCPYGGENAKGNVATEAVLALLDRKQLQHSLNAVAIEKARQYVLSYS